ncbi:MAG: DUF2306 domain-containing protein [Pseudomonadota bacterium]
MIDRARTTHGPTQPVIRVANQFWTIGLVLSALYIASMAAQYLWVAPVDYPFGAQAATYTANRWTMMLHIGFGVVALLAGTLQFVPQLKRFRYWHRGVGIVYCTAVGIAGVAGLRAAGFAYGGVSNTLAFGLMSTFWLMTTGLSLFKLWLGDVRAHQRWMKRSFAITLGAITLRIELGLFIFAGGLSFADTYLIVPWTSWVLNLLIAEWWPGLLKFRPPPLRRQEATLNGHHALGVTPSRG